MKDLTVTKVVKEIKFEGVWAGLEAKKCFQRQSFTKYLRLILVSCEIAHYGKSLNSIFQKFFLVLTRFSFWQEKRALGYHSMKFRHFSYISEFPKILSLKSFGNS